MTSDLPREAQIVRLNKKLEHAEIEIENEIKQGILKCTGKEYNYAVFQFKKENKTIKALFIKNHKDLTIEELKELKITKDEIHYFDCPGLEGVWFNSIIKKTVYGKTYELPRKIYDNVRLARPEDAPRIFTLSKLMWHDSRGTSIGPDFYKDAIQNKKGRDGNYIWVYCDNTGEVQGYIYTMVLPKGKKVVIWEAAVSEEAREQRIAKTLLSVAMSYMENVFSATMFDAYPGNDVSRHLIEGFGFTCGIPGALGGLDGPVCYKANFTDYVASKLESPSKEFSDSRALSDAMRAIILARRSTRKFDSNETLDRIIVEVLVDNARDTLSYLYDMSDFEIDIYDDPTIKHRLATEIKGRKRNGRDAIRVNVQPQPKEAPFSIVISVKKDALRSNRNKTLCMAGMLIETILLSATSIGIDSLWISSFDDLKVKEICSKVDSPFIPIAILPLGYRSKNPIPAKRLPIGNRIKIWTDIDTGPLRLSRDLLIQEAKLVNTIEKGVHATQAEEQKSELTAILSDSLEYPKAMNILSNRYGNAPPLEPLAEDIDLILEKAMKAAQWAPSARNLQSTDFIVIKDRKQIENICGILAIDHSTVGTLIIPAVNTERLRLIKETNANDTSTEKRAMELFGYLDGGAAIQNILFSLSSMGYAADWIFGEGMDTRIFEPLNISVTPGEYLGVIAIKQADTVTPLMLTQKEAKRVHTENLKSEYIPTVPNKTILCHIIADSILPAKQRPMLNNLEVAMRDESFREKVAWLKVDNSRYFVDQVAEKIEKIKDYYKAEYKDEYKNYTFQFDIACPSKELVGRIQDKLGLQALAFAKEGEGDIIQAEGIMLALRALRTGKIEDLLKVYKLLTGKEFKTDIKNIKELAKNILFILPVTKLPVDEIEIINTLIEENIKNAA
jgi:nitroreductase/RimJ/RimL family protein N-acetyltransferase